MDSLPSTVPVQPKGKLTEDEALLIKREKARLRKQRNRLLNPEANRLNDLRARVRKRCIELMGRIDNDWVIEQCNLRKEKLPASKRAKAANTTSSNSVNTVPSTNNVVYDSSLPSNSSSPESTTNKKHKDEEIECAKTLLSLHFSSKFLARSYSN